MLGFIVRDLDLNGLGLGFVWIFLLGDDCVVRSEYGMGVFFLGRWLSFGVGGCKLRD